LIVTQEGQNSTGLFLLNLGWPIWYKNCRERNDFLFTFREKNVAEPLNIPTLRRIYDGTSYAETFNKLVNEQVTLLNDKILNAVETGEPGVIWDLSFVPSWWRRTMIHLVVNEVTSLYRRSGYEVSPHILGSHMIVITGWNS
jgi:hypothetical protein